MHVPQTTNLLVEMLKRTQRMSVGNLFCFKEPKRYEASGVFSDLVKCTDNFVNHLKPVTCFT